MVTSSPSRAIVPDRLPSIRCRTAASASPGATFGAASSSRLAAFVPPYGSPGTPSQWNGSVSRRPRSGMVDRGMIWSPPVTTGVFSTHSSWSVWPSGWQLAQPKVPVREELADSNATRPRLTCGSVGSSSGTVSTVRGAAGSVRSTSETLFSTAFSTHARRVSPASSSATPRGTAPTSQRPRTAPVVASTVNSASEAAAVATSVRSSDVTAIAYGVASAAPGPGSAGGGGSRSKKVSSPPSGFPPTRFTLVI